MCGIAGVFAAPGQPAPEPSVARRMLATIRHRGPDQFGIYHDERTVLGNARLSIIDLESGQQPLTNEDSTLWIVYNGEIFNYVELREDLIKRGHLFSTRTDTEVILHLYEEYGPECLSHLNGQFAFAIRDLRNDRLFLARDRLGIRPLFYTVHDGALVFGSEVKAILAVPGIRAEMDPGALHDIFTYWSTITPDNLFKGVNELPPAHYMLAESGGGIRTQRYWSMSYPDGGGTPRRDVTERQLQDWTAALEDLLINATRIRLRADVPVGAYLSGGLDSSLIAAIARREVGANLNTFSISFADPQFDESEHQIHMAKVLDTKHHVTYATHASIGAAFPKVVWHTETPLLRTSPAPMFLLSSLVARSGMKVVLTGEGADEILAGYDIFKESTIRRFWAKRPESRLRPRLLARLYPDVPVIAGGDLNFLSMFFAGHLTSTSDPGYSHDIRWRNNRRTTRFFSPEVIEAARNRTLPASISRIFPPEFESWGALSRAQFIESSVFLPSYLLSSQGDRVAMANSVEGRFPFLDVNVVEFCNSLPECTKLRGLTEKHLLRRVAKRYLPDAVRLRPKRPYRAPIHKCFAHPENAEWVSELLSPGQLKQSGYFCPEAVQKLLGNAAKGEAMSETDDMAIAGIISTQLIHRQFIDSFNVPEPLSEKDDVRVCGNAQSIC
jgi:asparagine synthase (glutamine-hydrolysing)